MKSFRLSSVLVLFTALLSFIACTEEEYSEEVYVPMASLPDAVEQNLSLYFPDETPISVEVLMDNGSGKVYYYIRYNQDAYIALDTCGELLSMKCPEQMFPIVLREKYSDAFGYVESDFADQVCAFRKTEYGIALGMKESGNFLGVDADTQECLGYELTGGEGYEDVSDILPDPISPFLGVYFPDIKLLNVLIPTERMENPDFSYKVWLDEGYVLTFDRSYSWKVVENNLGSSLPKELLDTLPEKVADDIRGYCPEWNIVRMEKKVEDDTIQYYFETTENKVYVISIDNPNRPIQWPDKELKAFIQTYFNLPNNFKRTIFDVDLRIWVVALPNGFDFAMNEAGEWLYVDGHGFSFSSLKEPIIPLSIIQEVENHYQVTIERVAPLPENPSEGYLLRDASGISYTYTEGEIRRLETSWSTNEKIHRYIRSHYPEDLKFEWVRTQDGVIIYRLADGTELRFDAQGELIQ